ncbi:MAG: hypothetical protein ACFFAU_01070 [Candidatus Hodarchaeota archaeon]
MRTGKGKSDTRYSAVPGKIKIKVDYDKLEVYNLNELYGKPTVKYVEDVLGGKPVSDSDTGSEEKKEEPEDKLPDIDDLDVNIESDLELD